MRTTVNLPDHLYRAARVKAARDGRTMTSLLEEALRKVLDDSDNDLPRYRVRPLTGTEPPTDLPLNDNAALRDLIDDTGSRA